MHPGSYWDRPTSRMNGDGMASPSSVYVLSMYARISSTDLKRPVEIKT
jgi:hypothetical protein